MTGVSLSRWTMSYFAAALVALLATEALMATGFGFPNGTLNAPETLVLVHLVAVGWLSLLMCGALIQFVPVLVVKPLYSSRLPLPALLCLILGLLTLILGFLQLAGRIDPVPPFLESGAILLSVGFALVLWNLVRTLWRARPLPLPARFVTIGLLGVAATVCYGAIFALVLSGRLADERAVAFALEGVPVHAIAGLGGWLTFTAMGVSYRLLAMFMLAPELAGRRTRAVLYLGTAALAVCVLGGSAAIQYDADLNLALGGTGILGTAAAALYGADILHLYRARKRRNIELNSRMAGLALASFALSGILIAVLLGIRKLADHADAVVFLVAFGWLSGLGLAKLYKIVAFLTWLECYGPVLGKTATPRVQDLVVEKRAAKWFFIYFLSVWCATAALLLPDVVAFQIAAVGMLAGTGGIVVQLVRTRLLLDVSANGRFPAGAVRPAFLFSVAHRT